VSVSHVSGMSREALNDREVTRHLKGRGTTRFELHAICRCLPAVVNAGGDKYESTSGTKQI
jgi:hypothetical protein